MKKILLMAALLMAPFASQAVIIDENTITGGGAGSIGYSTFSLTGASMTTIQTFTDDFDPYMYLFFDDGSLDAMDFIASNDDGGVPSAYGFNNSLLTLNLAAGNYIVAVGDFAVSLSEAVSGINDASSLGIGAGTYQVDVISDTLAVPEPSIAALLGLGLVGMTLVRRKV